MTQKASRDDIPNERGGGRHVLICQNAPGEESLCIPIALFLNIKTCVLENAVLGGRGQCPIRPILLPGALQMDFRPSC